MNDTSHERAKGLLAAVPAEVISRSDREWLDAHLAGCRDCSDEAKALAKMKPDIVVCTHFLPLETLGKTKQKGESDNSGRKKSAGARSKSARGPFITTWVSVAAGLVGSVALR